MSSQEIFLLRRMYILLFHLCCWLLLRCRVEHHRHIVSQQTDQDLWVKRDSAPIHKVLRCLVADYHDKGDREEYPILFGMHRGSAVFGAIEKTITHPDGRVQIQRLSVEERVEFNTRIFRSSGTALTVLALLIPSISRQALLQISSSHPACMSCMNGNIA